MNRGRGARAPLSPHRFFFFFSPGFTPGRGIVYRIGEDEGGEGRGCRGRGTLEEGVREATKIVHLSRNNLH